ITHFFTEYVILKYLLPK
ncbi:TPA: stress response small protein YobI, partial [Escherichia coli]|nr:stress response small protein YobI [Escherichia coli]HBE6381878.1 stress response small protein YobI [Escherichia coli]HDT3051930.1 stress response small protein YobI [Escherichia coli]HDW1575100.1 stress response small protein YobI [Escherichia coli]